MTCPRCGQQAYPSSVSCPRCGLPFAPAPAPYAGGAPGEPAPDWLRNLPGPANPPSAWPGAAHMPGGPGYGPPASGYGQQAAPAPYTGPGMPPPPQAPAPMGGSFSAGSLISDDALPEWMRQGNGAGAPSSMAGGPPAGAWPPAPAPYPGQSPYPQQPPYPQQQPAAGPLFGAAPGMPDIASQATAYQAAPMQGAPAPQPGGAFPGIEQVGAASARQPVMGGGMSAQSLLDASAVPNWLTGQAPPSQPATPYGAGAPAGEGMSAQALIDERALPQWMRAEPATPAAPTQGGSVAQWLTASATEERPPTWLDQVYSGAQVPPAQPPNPLDGFPSAPQGPMPGSVSAGQFVDDSALPGWLKAQGSANPGAPAPSAVPPNFGATGRVPAPDASGWGPAQAGAADEATQYLGQAPVGDQRQPPWMRNGQAAGTADPVGAPRSGDLSARELPPWLRDDQSAPAANARLPLGQGPAGADQWAGQPWDQAAWEQQGYAGQPGDWNAPDYREYPGNPNDYADQGAYGGYDGYEQSDQYDPYGQYGQPDEQYGQYGQPDEQYGQYGQYGQPDDPYAQPDPYNYDVGGYDPNSEQGEGDYPPDPNARAGWRRIFRRK